MRGWQQLAHLALMIVLVACHELSGFADLRFEQNDGPGEDVGLVPLSNLDYERVDILLAIDNSRAMGDKQQFLNRAVRDLVDQLVNPRCLASNGEPAETQPAEPEDGCPAGSARAFTPVRDLHLGVVTSSLGGHGGDACDSDMNPTANDRGHLITRTSVDSSTMMGGAYAEVGFLAWDPDQQLDPPGETDPEFIISELEKVVLGAGELGCGFEASLESWYRFLVSPDPYEQLDNDANNVVLVGIDETLLKQRQAFLRPDSLLAIIMLSDENDCSIRDGGQSYFAFQIYQPGSTSAHHLPKPRRACATDPTDDCCASCGESVPASCQPELDDCDGPLDPLDDHINLRCFDQRRRFGIDFLHSVERYSDGLSEDYVPDRNGELVPNPIFSDLDPDDDLTGPRAKSLVFLAGIVGVPWQDIARKNADDQPDLLAGLDPSGAPIGGFQTGVELATGNVWEILIGDPETYTAPSDPFMIESIEPRQGLNPLTGDTIEPPNARPLANSINGHEYDNPGRDDLQFACIFPIEPRDCEQLPIAPSCECVGNAISNRSPLCQDPLTGEYGTVQHYAQSRPAVRQLQVIQAMGGQGLVGSVCVKQIDDELALDFGYRPAVSALGDRLRQSLGNTYCLSQPLPTTGDASGQAACTLIEARATEPGECNCDAAARSALTDDNLDDVHAIKDSTPEATWNCFCGVLQAAGTDLAACQSSTDAVVVNATFGHAVNAWCYVDTAVEPPIGSASLTEACAPEERALRFAGDTAPVPGASAFLVCGSSS